MTNKKLTVLIFSFLAFLTACRQGESKIEETYYSNGKIKTRTTYKDSCNLYNKIEEFYDNGILESFHYELNGDVIGPYNLNYKNGELLKKGFFDMKTFYLDEFEYYLDGRIKLYSYYAPAGRLVFQRSYDSITNEVKKETGSWNPIVLSTVKDTIKTNDTLKLQIHFKNPPEFVNTAKIKYIHSNKKNEVENLNSALNPIQIERVLKDTGIFRVEIISVTKDRERGRWVENFQNHIWYVK